MGAIAQKAGIQRREKSESPSSQNRHPACLVILAFVLWFAVPAEAAPALSSTDLTKSLGGHTFTMLHALNVAAKQYYRVGNKEFVCRHKLTGLFPNGQDLANVSIVRVREDTETEVINRTAKYEGNRMVTKSLTKDFHFWVFTLGHPHLGKGEFRITTASGELPTNRDEVMEVIGFVLTGEGVPRHSLLRAATGSKLVHFVGSGHAPEGPGIVEFNDLEQSLKAGYGPCFLCFNHRLRLANLKAESELGKETEATLRHYNQFSKNVEAQERIERLGRKVLANWPLRLIGYNYRFNVIDNPDFNAVACAGGYIFVCSGLADVVESDEEMEAVLAHEVAHVEQRHGIKELVRAKRAANAAAIFSAVVTGAAAVAVASTHPKSEVTTAATRAIAEFGIWLYVVGARIALEGYSREHEMEADIWAMNYAQKMGCEKRHMISLLRKLRTSVDLENLRASEEGDTGSSHPAPNNRIHVAENIVIDQWPEGIVFDAFNREDELVYSLAFQGACTYSKRDGSRYSMVLLEVSSTAALAEAKDVDELVLTSGNLVRRFKSETPYELAPMDRLGMAFRVTLNYNDDLRLTPAAIGSPRLSDIEATRIARRPSGPEPTEPSPRGALP